MESIWSQYPLRKRSELQGDLETEIAVIGAGMAGILTAYLLQKAGHRAVVLEAARIAGGQTRNTTAKITAQHGLIYQKLTAEQGTEEARLYAEASSEAVQAYRHIVEEKNIDCDFEEQSAYVYGNHVSALKAEAEAARKLGLPASFTEHVPLPVSAAGAVRFSGQAQFHPLKFIGALAEELEIYENTPVRTVEDTLLQTDHGAVQAKHIVFACHYPFVNFPGMYFARMHQERSYVLALEHAADVHGMWIGAEKNGYSFRYYGNLLLLGGEGHRTGESSRGGRYAALERKAQEWFPESRVVARWSAQDCITPDSIPYIGRYADTRPNWYVATGFQKWGMTGSMVSAQLLRDLICGAENPYVSLFDPGRFDLSMVDGVMAEGGQAVKGLARRLFRLPEETAREIPAGHGGIVLLDGEKVGVYKEENGTLHTVDVRCPHLGCQLEWNPDEKSWDCPCHGSRFDFRGKLLSGPAQEDISHG